MYIYNIIYIYYVYTHTWMHAMSTYTQGSGSFEDRGFNKVRGLHRILDCRWGLRVTWANAGVSVQACSRGIAWSVGSCCRCSFLVAFGLGISRSLNPVTKMRLTLHTLKPPKNKPNPDTPSSLNRLMLSSRKVVGSLGSLPGFKKVPDNIYIYCLVLSRE